MFYSLKKALNLFAFKPSATTALALLAACVFATAFWGCTHENTAGVLTETESGETATNLVKVTGMVKDVEGNPLPLAWVYLTGEDSTYHTTIIDSVETDSHGFFMFDTTEDWALKSNGTYNILVQAEKDGDSISAFVGKYNEQAFPSPTSTDSLFSEITAGKKATIIMYTKGRSLYNRETYADSLCFTGTFVCTTVTEKDIERGYISFELPSGIHHHYRVWFGDKVTEICSHKDLKPGEIFHWANSMGGDAIDSTEYTLPESTQRIMDSLGLEPLLESLFTPVKIPNEDIYPDNRFLDDKGSKVRLQKADDAKDSTRFWARLNTLSKQKQTVRWIVSGYIGDKDFDDDPINRLFESVKPGITFDDTLFKIIHHSSVHCIMYKKMSAIESNEVALGDNCTTDAEWDTKDSSFAVAFWIEADGSKTTGAKIFTAGDSNIGFEMAQCESDPQSLCTKIYTGVDSIQSDSIVYGKAKILDGERHHVALVIFGKHLTIAVDGVVIRDTDLKPSSDFTDGFAGITIGNFELKDFMTFVPGDYMKKPEEKGWGRIGAWLNAFYQLQK